MASRLLLGCGAGTVGHALIERARERADPVHVVTLDPEQREFPQRDVTITAADPADPSVLAGIDGPVASAFIGTDSPERNVEIARAASDVFTSVPIVAFAGHEPTAAERETLSGLVGTVLDPTAALREYVGETVTGQAAQRARHLRSLIGDCEGELAVVLHDNPDPDAIASGVGLATLARSFGAEAGAYYFGEISHQENRALINVLDLDEDLTELDAPEDIAAFDAIALVDHSLPGVNDRLPEDTPIDIVIDHHPSPEPIEARHLDVRSEVGSTCTMIVEYFDTLEVEPSEELATALLFGIRTDTADFSRGADRLDFEAAETLLPRVDTDVLDQIERPMISQETFETLARAIRNNRVKGGVCTSCIGPLRDRDAISQAADRLLTMEGVVATLVYGFVDGTIYISARARGSELDIGETLREAFDQIGSAGGHAGMAGAQIPLGFLGEETENDDELLTEIVREVIDERFFETLSAYGRGDDRSGDEPDQWRSTLSGR
ncbi:DHH family phosphoesterase [Halalkalicoccus jeotgali]|uniref:Phosphoesterase RecJ domain protein n=1 Tax=Halalkalicoccus jeotgali (strain DSM 18796 / CECT 7217 / JCM 14584 / KCTC 4019 / B3) TaxID=795797 RepID=D8J5L5_HALJB|nr:DHH family phosphoesterase [Halalkalicoccus jeotgali]ADJ15711.1 phosphoesterase RecJ domain protein [Halalkalicoccus jeotgali B3]ELY36519.1 phosphoesterase RecJ domain-containing protein [Halalkalicoccus jeotgali B3]